MTTKKWYNDFEYITNNAKKIYPLSDMCLYKYDSVLLVQFSRITVYFRLENEPKFEFIYSKSSTELIDKFMKKMELEYNLPKGWKKTNRKEYNEYCINEDFFLANYMTKNKLESVIEMCKWMIENYEYKKEENK